MRNLSVMLTLIYLIGCDGTPNGRTLIHTQRVADGLCMVEISSPRTLKLDCLRIGPDGSTKVLWTEPFALNLNGDQNQLWVKVGEEIRVYREKGSHRENHAFERIIPIKNLGPLDTYTQGSGSNSGSLDESKIVWDAFFTTDDVKSLPPGTPGIRTEQMLKDIAKEHKLNVIAIKVSGEKP